MTVVPPHQSSLRSPELLAYYRSLCNQVLTVVDVETTGSVASTCRVIEISVLQADLTTGIHSQKTYLINPSVRIPQTIVQFTGITQAMVDVANAPKQIWLNLVDCLNQGSLTAHNLAFDYAFLQAEYQRLAITFHRPTELQFCTLRLSRLLLADLPSRSLPKLVHHFGFEVGPSHRAEADTLACWLLAKHLLTQIKNETDEELLARFSQQWICLEDAAAILGCTFGQAGALLESAGVSPQRSKRGSKLLYRRGVVEQCAQKIAEKK